MSGRPRRATRVIRVVVLAGVQHVLLSPRTRLGSEKVTVTIIELFQLFTIQCFLNQHPQQRRLVDASPSAKPLNSVAVLKIAPVTHPDQFWPTLVCPVAVRASLVAVAGIAHRVDRG